MVDHVGSNAVFADQDDDCDAFVQTLDARDFKPVIPLQAIRKQPRPQDSGLRRE